MLLALVGFNAVAEDKVLAVLDGENITEEQVMKLAFGKWLETINESKQYDIKKSALDDIIEQKLLEKAAKTKGESVEELVKQLQKNAVPANDVEARAYFEMQKKRFGGKAFDDVKGLIINQLSAQKKQVAVYDFIDSLKKKSQLKVNLVRPRVQVSTDDDPSIGTKGAPITIIEFSEFQCPYCKKARPAIDKVLSTYKGKVHYVFRDFPLSFHPQAKSSANAANCANEQGKYWEYSKFLWENQGKQNEELLFKIADDLKLNKDKFKKCVDDKKFFAEIDKDQLDGSEAGVSGTPAYFINGIFLSGAMPFEGFKKIIDEELATLK